MILKITSYLLTDFGNCKFSQEHPMQTSPKLNVITSSDLTCITQSVFQNWLCGEGWDYQITLIKVYKERKEWVIYFFLLQLERWFFDKITLPAIKVLSSNTKTDKSDDDYKTPTCRDAISYWLAMTVFSLILHIFF